MSSIGVQSHFCLKVAISHGEVVFSPLPQQSAEVALTARNEPGGFPGSRDRAFAADGKSGHANVGASGDAFAIAFTSADIKDCSGALSVLGRESAADQFERVDHVAVEDGRGTGLLDVFCGMERTAQQDSVDVNADVGKSRAPQRKLGVVIIRSRDTGEGLNGAQRVVDDDGRQILQLRTIERIGSGYARLNGIECARLHGNRLLRARWLLAEFDLQIHITIAGNYQLVFQELISDGADVEFYVTGRDSRENEGAILVGDCLEGAFANRNKRLGDSFPGPGIGDFAMDADGMPGRLRVLNGVL